MIFSRKSVTVAGLALAFSLVISGCASNDAVAPAPGDVATTAPADLPTAPSPADVAAVDAIEVSGATGSEPEINFSTPLNVSFMTIRMLDSGTGFPLEQGQLVTIDVASWRGSNGEQLFSTWEEERPEVFQLGSGQWAILEDVLADAHIGARVMIANPTSLQGENLTVVSIFEVVDAQAPRASGEMRVPTEGLPTVSLAENGEPSITIPEGYQPPDQLISEILVDGTGPEVTADSYLTVHYTGWLLNGEVFDSSWSRLTPAGFPLPNVITGWREGLLGKRVGSQVLLVVPPAYGYEDRTDIPSIPAGSTLIFVVDILHAS